MSMPHKEAIAEATGRMMMCERKMLDIHGRVIILDIHSRVIEIIGEHSAATPTIDQRFRKGIADAAASRRMAAVAHWSKVQAARRAA